MTSRCDNDNRGWQLNRPAFSGQSSIGLIAKSLILPVIASATCATAYMLGMLSIHHSGKDSWLEEGLFMLAFHAVCLVLLVPWMLAMLWLNWASLKGWRWRLIMGTAIFAIVAAAVCIPELIIRHVRHRQGMNGFSQTVPDKPDPDIALGLREWPPITNGLVFIDGEYLLPPYTVTRNEANIYINGRRVETVIKWPPHKRATSPVPEKDIAMPSSINDKTTQYDYSFINYVNSKKEYLLGKYGQKKGIEMMVEVYRSLPCVKDAQFNSDNPNCITVVWNTGEICNINQMFPQRQEDDLTVEQAKHMVDKVATIYVRGLDDSNYFIFGNATMRGTMDSYQRVLQPLSDALRTSVDEKAFITAIRTNQLFSGFSDTAARSFFKHKDDVPKWESKISKQLPVTEEPGTRQPPQVP